MKIFAFVLAFAFVIISCGKPAVAQVPAGGAILNTTTGTTYQKVGKGTLTQVDVTGQFFTKALRMTTGTDINNFWDSQIQFPSVAGITTNDVILVAFYARTISSVQESGESSVSVVIEHKTTYEKEISTRINIGREWKQYYAPVKSKVTWSAADTRFALFTGFLSQTIEVADVKFINYKNSLTINDLPVTEITYFGQAPDAEWRAPATERINQIRKGIIDITVFDELGNAVPNANVSIEMTRHKFGFGTAIPANVFITNTIFRNKVVELFNEVVFENDLKWGSFDINNTLNLRKSLDSLDRYKIAVRGHNVIWPSWKFTPSSLKTLETNPVALRMEIDKRIDQVTQFTKGRLNDWDVINEPYSEKDVMTVLGDNIMADWFKRVRNNDRTVKLYLNDYAILSGGGINTVKQDFYYNLVGKIESWGGTVDGIGFQGHFGSDLTSIPKVYSVIDRFAKLGKEIKITEHDINVTQRQVQAEYTRDFMTICFSHEAVKSFLFWGFWANSHWLPEGAMFNPDWTIRPHGEAYKDLVFNQWWTKKTDRTTDLQGKVSFDGFLGTYRYTIKSGDKTRTGTLKIDNSKKSGVANPVILSFDTAIPDVVEIKASKPACLCQGENIVLSTSSIPGITYQWFNGDSLMTSEITSSVTTSKAGSYSVKLKKGTVEIVSPAFQLKVNPIPPVAVAVSGSLSFCPSGKTTLTANGPANASFNWFRGTSKIEGSATSVDITQTGTYWLKATANGCTATAEPVSIQVFGANSPECTTGINENEVSCKVYPNPFSGSFTLETGLMNNAPVTAELYNALGARVKNIELNQVSGKTTINVSSPGFYTLRVSTKEGVKVFKLVGN